MKLGPVNKLTRETKPKKLTMTSCQQVVTLLSFFMYGQFGAIRKLDSG